MFSFEWGMGVHLNTKKLRSTLTEKIGALSGRYAPRHYFINIILLNERIVIILENIRNLLIGHLEVI